MKRPPAKPRSACAASRADSVSSSASRCAGDIFEVSMTGFGSIVGIESPPGFRHALEQTEAPNAAQAFQNPIYGLVNIRQSRANGKQPQCMPSLLAREISAIYDPREPLKQ